jgi:hypothetical protein
LFSGGSDLQDKVFKIMEESSDDTELSVPLNIRKPGPIYDSDHSRLTVARKYRHFVRPLKVLSTELDPAEVRSVR